MSPAPLISCLASSTLPFDERAAANVPILRISLGNASIFPVNYKAGDKGYLIVPSLSIYRYVFAIDRGGRLGASTSVLF
jgi:hypothetical protein